MTDTEQWSIIGDPADWPGLDLAYEFVRPSYDLIGRRADAAEARARASLGFAGTLMVAAPAFVAATLGPGNRSFSSPWFILGALAFVGVLGCVVAQQLPRVVGGDLQVITPGRLATEAWLKATPPQFKWNLLLWAATDWDSNRALVDRMVNIATVAAVLLGVQVASLAIWVLVR